MLTQDEAELYDRQIRLWGVNAQSRIRQSKVLMLGFGGIASEVAKILVLAGIDLLTIVDDKEIQESDLTSNLFCRPTVGDKKKFRTYDVDSKLKKLNPLVKVNIRNISILDLKPEDYDGFDLVTLHSFVTIEEINLINKVCREKNIKFYIVLDYGFFGFMFNDLGREFKFTYEVFENIEDGRHSRQSGEKKDPISIGDDAQDEDDENLDSSEDEDNRPKKKRRIHSPKREPETKSANEKTTKVGTLSYAPFHDMISSKSHNCNSMTSPILFTSITLLKFYSQYSRFPKREDSTSRQEDLDKLNEILDSIYMNLNVSQKVKDKLDPDWIELIHGSLSPICAVLGGVAGQDMIRALSTKDIPICNTFLFDGTTMTGIVDKIGLSNLNQQVKPIVRDFIQFDDDD